MTPEQSAEILRLRDAKVAPKQIARKLGLRPAEVKTFIQNNAEAAYLEKAKSGDLQPLQGCLVNQGAAQALLGHSEMDTDPQGLAQVIVARQERNRLVVGSYLVDYWCLGVKDTIPPRKMGEREYQLFCESCVMQFNEDFVSIALEEAQAIVYGAIDYADSLGFKPHRDFNTKAQVHLGLPPDTLKPLEFGQDGKPFFVSGPYDDTAQVIRTLEASVGKDNFHFLAGLGGLGPDDMMFLE